MSSGRDGPGKRTATIRSVSIAAQFLDVLSRSDGPLMLGEIARRCRAGTSTTHRYMQSLVLEGLATQDEVTGRYDLGPAALRVGLRALARIEPVEIAARAMQALSLRIAASCGVAIWTERGPTIVRWYRSTGFTISTVGLGDVLPLDSTAAGLVFQAHLRPDVVAAARKMQPPAFRGVETGEHAIQATREIGGAELEERLFRLLTGKAAPVFNAMGEIACVVATVSFIQTANAEGHRDKLFDAARDCTRASGGI